MTDNTKRPRGRSRRSPENVTVDNYVGQRMRLRRGLLGMSQEVLAERLGITFQQVQKYERGANRVSASRLWDLSRALDVPVSFFFDGLDDMEGGATPAAEPDMKRWQLETVRRMDKLPEAQRKAVFNLVATIANEFGGGSDADA
ncbi:helix-turn-helix domain-containing protein [Niveispirillum sp. KHB5.9]|uniref:helix-turn-helix domain-containing protein n=1 Tax=Niveispirillum sp. KHB5.9 TaxID=3400269 RepID=UPI003A87B5B1